MGKQHRSFGKDMEMLAEAYNESSLLGGAHMMQGMGVADQAASALAHDDGYNSPEEAAEDSTGHLSDHEILKRATTEDGNLKPEARDALAKLYGSEDQETGYEDHMNKLGAEHDYTGSGKGDFADGQPVDRNVDHS
tara:strand:- start:1085 stop:1492 length:408 start_codon:yes stop_codon:yes gene_type:complete